VQDFVTDFARAGKSFAEKNKNAYSPNLAPAEFFLLKKPKWWMAGQSLYQDSIKNTWEGVARSLIAVDFPVKFRSWLERYKKCVRLGGEFFEKS
jgi:hypothetical protein